MPTDDWPPPSKKVREWMDDITLAPLTRAQLEKFEKYINECIKWDPSEILEFQVTWSPGCGPC